jgi:hypothetical protein
MECLFVNLLGVDDLLENPPLAGDIEAPQAAVSSIDDVRFSIRPMTWQPPMER